MQSDRRFSLLCDGTQFNSGRETGQLIPEKKNWYTADSRGGKTGGEHRPATSSVIHIHLHLKGSGHSLEDSQVGGCTGRKEPLVLGEPSLNRGGGLKCFLSSTYNAVFHSFHHQKVPIVLPDLVTDHHVTQQTK